jgi:hypothetical protein
MCMQGFPAPMLRFPRAGCAFVEYRSSQKPSHAVHLEYAVLNTETLFFFYFMRWDFGYCRHYWPIVPAPDDRWWWLWRNWWNENWQGKPKYSEKTYPRATLSTTNPTWLDPVLNPSRCGGKPATNRLSYGASLKHCYYICLRTNKEDRHRRLLTISLYTFWSLFYPYNLFLGTFSPISKFYAQYFRNSLFILIIN